VSAVSLRRVDAASARQLHSIVELIHQGAYANRIATGELSHGEQTFITRFDTDTTRDGFDLVLAYDGDEPVGQAWGWALTSGTTWWTGLETDLESEFTNEDGKRTFVLAEVMVRQAWTGRGIAHALHDQLLSGRDEKRATLLVRPENTAAYRAYLKWGWRKVAQLRPGLSGAPLMDVLVRPLPGEQRA
jgi:ribosomal protein S18 acetylase RimI-like enzyme